MWVDFVVGSLLCFEIACVASVSVGFGSKQRPRNNRGAGFSVFCLRGKWGESQKKNGGGSRGREGRNRLQTNPWSLKTPFAGDRGS